MGFASFVHTCILFCAFVCCLWVCLTAPVLRFNRLLDVTTPTAQLRLGLWGWCDQKTGHCSKVGVGYDLTQLLTQATGFKVINGYTTLTKGLVVVPITGALTLIGFVISACSHRFGYMCSAFFSLIAFVFALVGLIIETVLLKAIQTELRKKTTATVSGFLIPHWLLVGATVALFLCPFFGFYECCAARREQRASKGRYVPVDGPGVPLAQYPQPMGRY
ncbi:hypothetical protein Q8F55_006728 [Vanrija albida]|uniref:Pali-domain-containing protein n=1 Tax=Vanrija albida TaxID=181172 RepID=A0ABR3PXZ6_9TREE